MVNRKAVLFVFIGLLLVGCGGGLEKKVVGKWKLKLDTTSMTGGNKAGADLTAKLLEAMTIELKSDKTTVLTAGPETSSGTWSLTGDKITITTGKGNPMTGTVSSDGSTITPEMNAEEQKAASGAKMLLVKSP